MTERIIDVFEMVQVEAQHRHLPISGDPSEGQFHGFAEHGLAANDPLAGPRMGSSSSFVWEKTAGGPRRESSSGGSFPPNLVYELVHHSLGARLM